MDREEKAERLDVLHEKLNKLESANNPKRNTARYLIDRDRLRREIRDLNQTMTDEDWKKFMEERSEINVREINYKAVKTTGYSGRSKRDR